MMNLPVKPVLDEPKVIDICGKRYVPDHNHAVIQTEKYEIIVYRRESLGLEEAAESCRVVLKRSLSGFQEGELETIKASMKISQISNVSNLPTNIVERIVELNEAEGYYVCMHLGDIDLDEYIFKATCDHLLGASSINLIKTLNDVASQLIRCTIWLHALGILHKDIKPDNLRWDTKSKLVKLIDTESMSMIHNRGDHRKAEEYVFGSEFFMPDEVIYGDNCYPYRDIYAAAMVIIEFILGLTSKDVYYKIFSTSSNKIRLLEKIRSTLEDENFTETVAAKLRQNFSEEGDLMEILNLFKIAKEIVIANGKIEPEEWQMDIMLGKDTFYNLVCNLRSVDWGECVWD